MNLLLAKRYTHQDVSGWWVSEKLDGVRAYWDGAYLFSRNGKKIKHPFFLPLGIPLDGELWQGRGMFQETVGVVKRKTNIIDWGNIKFHVFDCPLPGLVFEERIQHLLSGTMHRLCPDVIPVPFWKTCDLKGALATVEKEGGEGLMLRQPESLYEWKRSSTLLKVKSFQDAEFLVIGHAPGKGKHVGKLGALECLTEQGYYFKVGAGFSDYERTFPPRIGSTVTIKFQGRTNLGIPRFPTFWRVCK